MVFATPRSWERVSDILNIDSDVNKTVIRNKIIGNIGLAAGTQFVEFCKKQRPVITVQDLISGKATPPDRPDELSLLVDRFATEAQFLTRLENSELSDDQRKRLEQIIEAYVRLPQAEYAILGLKKLLDMNREAVKAVFVSLDSPAVTKFIQRNAYALGIANVTTPGKGIKENWMSLWK